MPRSFPPKEGSRSSSEKLCPLENRTMGNVQLSVIPSSDVISRNFTVKSPTSSSDLATRDVHELEGVKLIL
jgi:hypothetical protein